MTAGEPQSGGVESAAYGVADVGRMLRVDDFDRLEPRIGDAVEQALTPAENNRHDVENDLVDRSGRERLADR